MAANALQSNAVRRRQLEKLEVEGLLHPVDYVLNMKECARIEKLGKIGCTNVEIATIMDLCPRTLESNSYYMQRINRGRENIKMSLRRKQLEVALDGNVTMLVHLGKSMLHQHDRVQVDQNKAIEVRVIDLSGSDDEHKEQVVSTQ